MPWVKKQVREHALADSCLQRLQECIERGKRNDLDIGRELHQIKTRGYYKVWGYDTYRAWLMANLSFLNLTYTKAWFLVQQADLLRIPGVTDAKLQTIPKATLREIARLNPDEDAKQIKELVDVTAGANRDKSIRENIRVFVNQSRGLKPIFSFGPYHVREASQNLVISQAFESVKKGRDISGGEAFYEICEAYIQFCKS